jgi:hypothetical protein
MNRRDVIAMPAIPLLVLALLDGDAVAQQPALKGQLAGAWTLVSEDSVVSNGTKEQFYGPNPKGILILDASGRYALVQGSPDRPKLKSASRSDLNATDDELKALLRGFASNMGAWSVNDADRTLILKFEAALIPNNEGAEFKNTVNLVGDELTLTRTSPVTGSKTAVVYRRAK